MTDKTDNTHKTQDEFDVRNFFKRWPKFYFFVATVFGPLMFSGLSGKKFLEKYPRLGKTLNLGSGARVVGKGIINVDIHAYPGVEIVADACVVPLPNGSVARIISDNVLEHVKEPVKAVAEMHRLLEIGGLVYVATPFCYPYHSSPSDFTRWTSQGLIQLFNNFEVVEIGVRAGPFSSLTVNLNHLFATIFSFGSTKLYSLLLNLVMFVTFPIKLPDIIFNRWPKADIMAAQLYCVMRKK